MSPITAEGIDLDVVREYFDDPLFGNVTDLGGLVDFKGLIRGGATRQ